MTKVRTPKWDELNRIRAAGIANPGDWKIVKRNWEVLIIQNKRTLQISEGTPMEFYILPDGITLKVYHPETELLDIVEHFNNVLSNSDDLEMDKIAKIYKHLKAIEAVLKAGD